MVKLPLIEKLIKLEVALFYKYLRKIALLKKLAFSFSILCFSSLYGQNPFITGSSITEDNLKINIVFDEEIYASSACNTLTCIDVMDFRLSISGGVATLGSPIPTTITKLGNYNFVPFWNGGEPNNSGGENYAEHVGNGRLNDLRNCNNRPGVLEIIDPNPQTIPGYVYITSWPVGSPCAHSYYRSTTSGCWTDEKQKARDAGGDLLVYNSVEEYQYLVPGFATMAGVASTWIGLSQNTNAADYSEPSGGWYWDDGTPMDNSAAKVTYQLTYNLVGTPTGDERVTVNPVTNPRSVYNCGGTFAQIQNNGLNRVRLIDKTKPSIVAITVADDNSTITVQFQEEVFTDAMGNLITGADFGLSVEDNGNPVNLFSSGTPLNISNYNNRSFVIQLPLNGNHITGNEDVIVSIPGIFDSVGLQADNPQLINSVRLNKSKTGPIYLGMNYSTNVASGTLQLSDYNYFCEEGYYNNYNIAYHTGPNLEPAVGDYIILNYRYSYPQLFATGDDYAFLHLRGYDKILEIQKSNGLVVAKYNCN